MTAYLFDVVDLFADTLNAILSVDILGFFFSVLVFLLIVGVFLFLVRRGRRGRF